MAAFLFNWNNTMTCTKYGGPSSSCYDSYLDDVNGNNRLTKHPNEKYRTERRLKEYISAMKNVLKMIKKSSTPEEIQIVKDTIADFENYLPKDK